MTRTALTALLLSASLTAQAVPVAAQIAPSATPSSKPGEPKITDDYVNQLIRDAAQRAGVANPPTTTGVLPPPNGTPAAQSAPASVDLSLDDAIKLALDRNL